MLCLSETFLLPCVVCLIYINTLLLIYTRYSISSDYNINAYHCRIVDVFHSLSGYLSAGSKARGSYHLVRT